MLILSIKPTRQIILKNIIEVVNDNLEGKIEISDIRFNTLTDIQLDNIVLIANNDTLLNADNIQIKYKLLKLFKNEIQIDKLNIKNAKIYLHRNNEDSTWNFAHIAKPSQDTIPTETPNLLINVVKLNIENSQLRVIDELNKTEHSALNLTNLDLNKLNLTLSAYLELKNNLYKANLHSLSFFDSKSEFAIDNLKFSALLHPNKILLNNLSIQTDKSLIKGKVSISQFDVFGIDTTKTIETAILKASLHTENFYPIEFFDILSLKDIKIGGRLDFDIDVDGKLNDLTVNKFNVTSIDTKLDLYGHLWDLLSDNPKYELHSIDSDIYSNDIFNIVEYIPKEKIPLFNHIQIAKLNAIGDTRGVKTSFDFDTKNGKLKGKFDYKIWTEEYDCDISFEHLNLTPFFNNQVLLTDLTGNIKAKGKSFDLSKVVLESDLKLRNSKFQNYNIGFLDLKVVSDGTGLININELKYTSKFSSSNIANNVNNNLTIPDSILNSKSNYVIKNQSNQQIANDTTLNLLTLKINPEVDIKGFLDFSQASPIYKLKCDFIEFNIARFLNNETFPNQFTSENTIEGVGFEINEISLKLINSTELLMFGDRAFMPFEFDLSLNNQKPIKNLDLHSDFLDLSINGNYTLVNLFDHLALQNKILANFINNKINNLLPKLDTSSSIELFEISEQKQFNNLDCLIDIKTKDLSILSAFIGNIYFKSEFNTQIDLYCDSTISETKIQHFHIPYLDLEVGETKLNLKNFNIDIEFDTKIDQNKPSFNHLFMNLEGNQPVIFDDKEFIIKKFETNFKENDFVFNVNLNYDSLITLKTDGFGLITSNTSENDFSNINQNNSQQILNIDEKNQLNFEVNNLSIAIGDSLIWSNYEKILFINKYNSFDIFNLKLMGKNKDKFIVKGLIDFQNKESKDLEINLYNLKLTDITKLIDEFDEEKRKLKNTILLDSLNKNKDKLNFNNSNQDNSNNLTGLINHLNLEINNSFENPFIKVNSQIDDININQESFGSLNTKLIHSQSIISGDIDILSKKIGTQINVEVNKLPILLSIDDKTYEERLDKNENVDIDIKIDKLSLKTVEEYAPAISDLNGLGYLKLNIGGYLPNEIDYNGSAKFENVNFLVDVTNIRYKAEGEAIIKKELITLEKVKVFNYENDLKNGTAKVGGTISLKGTDIDVLDINMETKNFLVLNQKAKKTLRWIYGDLRIATGKNPIRFFGTLKKPNVNGDVDVLFADLVMPQEDISQIVKSKFNYVIKGSEQDEDLKNIIIIDKNKLNKKLIENKDKNKDKQKNLDSLDLLNEKLDIDKNELADFNKSQNDEESNVITANRSFSDLINYDLKLRMPGVFKVNMVINAAIELFAELSNKDLNKPLHYTKSRDEKDAKLFGDIVVKENSRLSFFKSFKTNGYLYFTTGNLFNPNLDLKANYRGRTTGSNPKDYLVDIAITGTKEKPIITYSYIIGNTQSVGDQSQILQNVFYLLTLGNLKDQMNDNSGFDLNRSTSDFANSMLADMATKQLNQVLAKSGLNAEINFDNGNIEQANIKLSGQVFNFAQLSYGGRLSDINSANEIQFSVPFSQLFNSSGPIDMILQASYINTLNTIQTQDQKIWEMKLKIGGSK